MWTLQNLLRKAAQFLKEKEVPSPRLEAEILLSHVLSLDRIGLYVQFARPIQPEELDRFRSLVLRRTQGEPSAYLVGRKEFFSLSFRVTPAVLIPRPETEELVQLALDLLPPGEEGAAVADVGTGSGCIPITLLKQRPLLRAVATDASAEALAVAEENARALGVEDRLRFMAGDLLAPLLGGEAPGAFRLITCNPPYVDPEGPLPVDREVACFEPAGALFTPPGDPLHYYRRMLAEAAPLLQPGGALLFELGAGMLEGVSAEAAERRWKLLASRKDLAGHERAAAFSR